MTKFHLTVTEIAGGKDESSEGIHKSSGKFSQQHVSQLIALTKLPDEIQSLVHKETIGFTTAYELSSLSFDINFP